MARKRRGRPRKKQSVTYNSKESKTVLALVLLLFSILAFLTYLVESDSFILETVRNLFGEITIVAGLLFLNLAFYFFNIRHTFNNGRSLFGQILFLLSMLIIFTSIHDKIDIKNLAYEGQAGGIIGYQITRFLERQLFAQFTLLFALVLLFLSIPLILMMTITEFIAKIGETFKGVKESIASKEVKVEQPETAKAAETFGDFSKRLDTSFSNAPQPKQDKKPQESKQPAIKISNNSEDGDETLMNLELQYPDWKLPPIDLLNSPPQKRQTREDIKGKSEVIEETLKSFNINAKVVEVAVGPTVTQYALDIPLGTKVSKIANLKNDIALALAVAANAVRIEAPIPGTSYIGIEVPNSSREAVYIKELVSDSEMKNPKWRLPVTIGKNIAGRNVIADIQRMPHLLVAGATGSGKSVLTNSFIMSLLMYKTPDELRFIMVDPKQVELSDYNGIPHLLTPVITEMDKVNNALKWAIAEMEQRYTLFKDNQVRNIEGYNEKKGFAALPYIVIVIDEMADMMMSGGAEIESSIVRLAQKARATGIHLILATQRPSVDVITGLIKANIPGRVGMSVTTQIDSRVILDQIGAESLLGMGDLLFKEPDKNKPFRLQGVLVTQDEVQRVVKFIKNQVDEVTYNAEILQKQADPNLPPGAAQSAKFSEDELFADAVRVVVANGKGSSSLIQRKLSVGYNRAARLLDELHKYGVVGPEKGSKPRDVLIGDAESFLQGGTQQAD